MATYKTGIDWSDCPIVETDPEKMGGRPTVRSWRMPADQVVENHDYGATEREIAEWYELPLEDVQAILTYAEKARQFAHFVR